MSSPLFKYNKLAEESDASRQQERVLEEELQQQEFENQVNAALGVEELNQEIYGKQSAKIIPISGATELPKQGKQDLFTIQSLIEIIGIGADSQEIAQFLEKAIDEIDATIEKDKSQAKKYVKQLQAIMVVVEQVAGRQRNADTNLQNANLQNSLRQMRDKLSTALKQDSPENLRNLLKSAELKNTLQQGMNNAAKNPELTKDMASRQQTAERGNAQKDMQQQSRQTQAGQESRQSQLNQILNRVMDRGREILGMNQQRMADPKASSVSAIQQVSMNRVALQNQPLQNNMAVLASMQAARMGQSPQVLQQSIAQPPQSQALNVSREAVSGDVSQRLEQQVNIKADPQRTEIAQQPRIELQANVRGDSTSTALQTEAKPIGENKTNINPTKDNTPPTSGKPKEVGSCGSSNCHCSDSSKGKTEKVEYLGGPTRGTIEEYKRPAEVQSNVTQDIKRGDEVIKSSVSAQNIGKFDAIMAGIGR